MFFNKLNVFVSILIAFNFTTFHSCQNNTTMIMSDNGTDNTTNNVDTPNIHKEIIMKMNENISQIENDSSVKENLSAETSETETTKQSTEIIINTPIFLSKLGETKYFGTDLFQHLRPAEIFKPIAEKFHNVINNFYPVQPQQSFNDQPMYADQPYHGVENNGATYLTGPALFWEKLNQKKQYLFSNAHGAIFGSGYLLNTDYPFAVRAANVRK